MSVEYFIKKLLGSLLTEEDAKILGMEYLEAEETRKISKVARPSIKLNYFNPTTKEPLADHKSCEPFYRLRYLTPPKQPIITKNPMRYAQPPRTIPAAYYPMNIEWGPILCDAKRPLIITEGELKAGCVSKIGVPTIGLGGVNSYKALKRGIEWLPSLDFPVWPRRDVFIAFDSDYATNMMVCNALWDLAGILDDKGAYVHILTVPALPNNDKTGIDDYLAYSGPSAKNVLEELLYQAEPIGLAKPLWGINEKYCFVCDPQIVIHRRNYNKIDISRVKFNETKRYHQKSLNKEGSIVYKPVNIINAWLDWPLRLTVETITYQPGECQMMVDEKGDSVFNTWQGLAVEPKEGVVAPFLTLIDFLFREAEEERHYFLQWLAYPLQNLGVKMSVCAVIWGPHQGTGKSLIGYTMGHIYGKNYGLISEKSLKSQFNHWIEGRQFIMADEITGNDSREYMNELQLLITETSVTINKKFLPQYDVPACTNFYFTSNQPDAFFLQDADRRFFIHEVKERSTLTPAFFKDYLAWIRGDGASNLLHYLLHYDVTGFEPFGRAMDTSAKLKMIDNVRSELGTWCRMLRDCPSEVLVCRDRADQADLFTTRELLAMYDPTGRTRVTANGLGREMSRAGFRQVLDGAPIKVGKNPQARYYIIHRQDLWEKASREDVQDHLRKYKV